MKPMLYIPFWNECSKCRILQIKEEREREIQKLQLHPKKFFKKIKSNDFSQQSDGVHVIRCTTYSFPGFSPTHPPEQERGWAEENPGTSMAVPIFWLPVMCLFEELTWGHRDKLCCLIFIQIRSIILYCAVYRLMGALWCCWLYCVKWVWLLVFPLNVAFNREEKSDVTLPWYQNFWITRVGSLSNEDGDDNENGKKAIAIYY